MDLKISEKAAKVIQAQLPKDGAGLRVGIRGGGCSGLSYAIEVGTKRDGDTVLSEHGIDFFVDPKSAVFLEGCTLEYVFGLLESGFKITNPRATRTCGCGESFSV